MTKQVREPVEILKPGSNVVGIEMRGEPASIQIGSQGGQGSLVITADDGNQALYFNGKTSRLIMGKGGCLDFDGKTATISIGGQAADGHLHVKDSNERDRLEFKSNTGSLVVRDGDGNQALYFNGGTSRLAVGGCLDFDGKTAKMSIGRQGAGGDFIMIDNNGRDCLHFDSVTDTLRIGREQSDPSNRHGARIVMHNPDGKEVFELNTSRGSMTLGISSSDGGGKAGTISLRGESGETSITIDGSEGDIKLKGADCAEDFETSCAEDIEPGQVMVIGRDNALEPCEREYDKRVAGVVSGAGSLNPGIVLGRSKSPLGKLPIALVGRVYCRVDATFSPIEVGDLLTTSANPGHAMKASDHTKAFGSVLGKALSPMKEGCGLIPILVALQ